MTSVFLTGASGLIGGQVLKEIVRHPREHVIRALVRDEEKAARISDAFPEVQTVLGSLDDVELVENEAAKASVVLNVASNKHMPSVEAIHRGLVKRQTPSCWVQVSGASALAVEEIASSSFEPGSPSSDIYDDFADIAKIRSLIRAHSSRSVDNYLLDVTKQHPSIRTAIVMPPIVYGLGEGPVNQGSIQVPALARVTLAKGHGIRVGKGLSRWGSVHVRDIGKVFAELADAGGNECEVAGVWGEDGIYLPSAADISFGEISDSVAQSAKEQGFIGSSEVEELSKAEAGELLPGGFVFFGTNARIKSRRAAELLDWKPSEGSVQSDIPRVVALEASKRG